MKIRASQLSQREAQLLYAMHPGGGAFCQDRRHVPICEIPLCDEQGKRNGTEFIFAVFRGESAAHVVDEIIVSCREKPHYVQGIGYVDTFEI